MLGNAKGTSTLEFIAVFPILMLVFLVGVELCRVWLTANIALNAVREGVRRAVVTPAALDPISAGRDRILDVLSGMNIPVFSGPTVTCDPSCVTDAQVNASVTVQFQPAFPIFLPQILTYNIQLSASMNYE
jgi:Flp pilus assembly protein TadG